MSGDLTGLCLHIYERTNVPFSSQCTWTLFHQPQNKALLHFYNFDFLNLFCCVSTFLRLDSNIESKSLNYTYSNIIEILFLL